MEHLVLKVELVEFKFLFIIFLTLKIYIVNKYEEIVWTILIEMEIKD